MNNTKRVKKEAPIPGIESAHINGAVNAPEATDVNLAQIEKWLEQDLQRCMTLLSALLSDKELRMQMAVWFEGRISNAKHKADPSEINKPVN